VCSKNVVNYEHFGEVERGRCPLHENVEARHEQEVKKAADEAMAKVRADHPDLSDADLMIRVSDRVKQAEDARKGQAQVRAEAFPYHMVENELRHRPHVHGVPALHQPAQAIAPLPQYVHPYAFAPFPLVQPFVPPLVQPPIQPPQLIQQLPPHYYNAFGPAPQQPPPYVSHRDFQPFQPFPYPYNDPYYGHPPDRYR
jgi:TRIAD3 protein (E3 ubiquitin-protein ligase RNF216)